MMAEPAETSAPQGDFPAVSRGGESPSLTHDEHGFRIVSTDGSRLEYRGYEFTLKDGEYDLSGRHFRDSEQLKKYLNQLKDRSA